MRVLGAGILGSWATLYRRWAIPPLSPVFVSRRMASEAVTGELTASLPSIHRPHIHPHLQQPL